MKNLFGPRSLFVCLGVLIMSLATAQPTVDITLVQTVEGPVEVRLRPDGPFDGLLSSVVFTIRWNEGGPAGLGSVQQFTPVNSYCSVSKSGPEQTANGFRYQVFAGFGFVPLSEVPTTWVPGEEIVLCRVNVINGSAAFSIVVDAWTSDINNNGDYFISLNGLDRTGEIYTISTGANVDAPEMNGPQVGPNPADDQFVLSLPEGMGGTVSVELMDASGRVVWTKGLNVGNAAHSEPIDVSGLSSGAYVLVVGTASGRSSHRIVVKH
ncbi:MAG: T9SS type A sorting domain-containing protein [Flavobacteriales bacterium]|jgi:hypothetical protein